MTWHYDEAKGWVEIEDSIALTAGEQDHDDPWKYAGEVADPPVNPTHLELIASKPLGVGRPLTATQPWRNCRASVTLVNEVNTRWPHRDKASDGTIGNAEHAARTSDHNPWVVIMEAGRQMGIVRARDIDADGVDMAWLMEYLRQRAVNGDNRLTGGGYLIFNRRITNPDFRSWRVYTGSNPHTSHGHVSFSQHVAGYDSTAGWGIASGGDDFLSALSDNEQRELLSRIRNLDFQLYAGEGSSDGKHSGWRTLPGGSNETLTVVDYLRRQNERMETALRMIASTPGVDPRTVAELVIEAMAPMVRQAVIEALGQDNTDKADQIVDLIGQRLLQGV